MWCFNIYILKANKHNKTSEFIDQMFRLGFYPLILKPNRTMMNSATLNNDIFVNKIDGKILYIGDCGQMFSWISCSDLWSVVCLRLTEDEADNILMYKMEYKIVLEYQFSLTSFYSNVLI